MTTDETDLLNLLLSNKKPQYARLETRFSNSVTTLDDGGMGSFLFSSDTNETRPLKIIPIAEYLFHDKDGIPVLATLYSYSDGQTSHCLIPFLIKFLYQLSINLFETLDH